MGCKDQPSLLAMILFDYISYRLKIAPYFLQKKGRQLIEICVSQVGSLTPTPTTGKVFGADTLHRRPG